MSENTTNDQKFLDGTGLAHLWNNKIKPLVSTTNLKSILDSEYAPASAVTAEALETTLNGVFVTSGDLDALAKDFVTTGTVTDVVDSAIDDAIQNKNIVTDTKLAGALEEYATTGDIERVESAYTDLEGTVTGLSNTLDEAMRSISSVYRAKGSFEDDGVLPESPAVGDVWNMIHEFTTTDEFVEGAGHQYPAGTNIVYVQLDDETKKWDVLAGMFDVSDITVAALTTADIDAILNQTE